MAVCGVTMNINACARDLPEIQVNETLQTQMEEVLENANQLLDRIGNTKVEDLHGPASELIGLLAHTSASYSRLDPTILGLEDRPEQTDQWDTENIMTFITTGTYEPAHSNMRLTPRIIELLNAAREKPAN